MPSLRLSLPLAAAVALAALVTRCVPLAEEAARETEHRLQGTWLREYSADGTQVRRVLTLAPGGAFRERARAVEASGRATEFAHEGTWLFDGTNLKRKYTSVNGQPPSRLNVPFATFEIRFDGRNAFRGIDHVRGHEVLYRRTSPDARP
jgi:hypothetical protein